jgi:hypothetical protein
MNMKTTLLLLFGLVAMAAFAGSCSSDAGSAAPSDGLSGAGQGGSMARFGIKDEVLYVIDHTTLKQFDISDARQPRYLSSRDIAVTQGIETIFIDDTLLFIGSQTGMYIYDVSAPGFPQRLSLSSHITSCDPVVAADGYAYVTLNSESRWCGRNTNEILVYDIHLPSAPELCYTIATSPASPKGLCVDGTHLFVCFNNGLRVYDLSRPAEPRWVADMESTAGLPQMNAYDILPVEGHLLVVGPDGFYQLDYDEAARTFLLLSQIPVTTTRQ